MELEEAKKNLLEIKEDFDWDLQHKSSRTDEEIELANKYSNSIETVLKALETYKRLAEANLKDSEEFKKNMCEHRCLLKSELENSIPKEVIEKKIDEISNETWYIGDGYSAKEACIEELQDLLEGK